MSYREDLSREIAEQVKGKEKSPVFTVGEHIKAICGSDEHLCEIVLTDLKGGHKVADVEKEIAAFAKKNGNSQFGFCSPDEAEKIIRKHFGIEAVQPSPEPEAPSSAGIDLFSFM